MQLQKWPVNPLIGALVLMAGCASQPADLGPASEADLEPLASEMVSEPPPEPPAPFMTDPVFDLPPNMKLQIPPARIGVDADLLSAAQESAAATGFVTAMLVAREGYLVAEHYFDEQDEYQQGDLRELSDVVASLLLGTAVQREEVALTAPLAEIFPDWAPGQGEDGVTLRDLGQHLSGLDFPATLASPEQLLSVQRESAGEPVHSPNDRVLVSHAIATATGRDPLEYAWDVIFRRLAISPRGWQPSDQPWMSEVGLTPQDLTRLLWIHANRGIWGDKHVVSRRWLNDLALAAPEVSSESWREHYPDSYRQGVFWRVHNDYQGFVVREISGPDGQRALFIPDVNAAVLILTAASDDPEQQRAQTLAVDRMMAEQILPSFEFVAKWIERRRQLDEQQRQNRDTSRPPWEQR